MSSKPNSSDFARTKLPWVAAGALFLIYLVTLNRWVSIRSLPVVSKVTGWDWTLPTQFPLFYTLTFPFRILPVGIQPIALNLFAAICAALTIWMLARSVTLLPHDRTDEQRVRMRHSDGLLGTKFGWAPATLAAAVLGLELTMWEHATAATNEALDLLIFAFLIWSLLEFRLSKNESWLYRFSFVYGLGVANNWALIGFFPLFLGAMIWIRGKAFFNLRFIVKMAAWGLVGMLLYLVLPILWALKSDGSVTFWEALRSILVTQKRMLLNIPDLRVRALIFSLASIVPVIIMGIKFPAGFGDISGPGSTITSFMFRLVHFVFAAACVAVAFDLQVSPRHLMMSFPAGLRAAVPFLTFYYLGALAAGYYVGYLLLVTSEAPRKHLRPKSALGKLLNPVIHGIAWLLAIAAPIALLAKNFQTVYSENGKLLMDFTESVANQLPAKPAMVMGDDPIQLTLLDAWFSRKGENPHILVNTKALSYPMYHRQLVKRYGARWPSGGASEDMKTQLDIYTIASALNSLATSNTIYYLHPSFDYLFEIFYPRQKGFVSELKRFDTNMIFVPRLTAEELKANEQFWKSNEGLVNRVESLVSKKLPDSVFLSGYLSRAANNWGVNLQKAGNYDEAAKNFELAVSLNTNNVPAKFNLEFNQSRKNKDDSPGKQKNPKDFFGEYRSWDQILSQNGPFDVPEILFAEGYAFLQQGMVRQACDQLKRSTELAPTNASPKVSLVSALIHGKWLDEAQRTLDELKAATNLTSHSQKLELISMEAAIYFGRQETNRAEATLLSAIETYPKEGTFYESLGELYRASGQWGKALNLVGREISMAPTNIALKMQHADLAMSAGDTNAAIADLNAVLKIDPANADATLFAAFVAMEQKDFSKASKLVNGILEKNPENARALAYQGIIAMENKDDEKAIAAFDRSLKIEPNNATTIRNRAIVNLRSGHLKAAKEDYETLQKSFPKWHVVYYGLGEIALKNKDNEEAANNYEQYLKYAPTNAVGEAAEERKTVETRLKELRGNK
jgi:tetratricopeptide (TPR) repeat protein